jgi:hypothetical protein
VLARPRARSTTKNRIEEQFISLQAFHQTPGGRVQKIITEGRFEPRILESFDPVTQEIYRLLPEMIHNNPTIQSAKENRGAECLTLAPED